MIFSNSKMTNPYPNLSKTCLIQPRGFNMFFFPIWPWPKKSLRDWSWSSRTLISRTIAWASPVTPFTEMTLDGMNCSELVVFLMWGFVFYPIEVTPIFEKMRGSNQPYWERDGCMHNSWEYDNPMGYSTWYGPYECVWKGWFTPDLWQGLGSLNWNPRGWFNHTAKTFQETLTQLNALYWTKQTEEKKREESVKIRLGTWVYHYPLAHWVPPKCCPRPQGPPDTITWLHRLRWVLSVPIMDCSSQNRLVGWKSSSQQFFGSSEVTAICKKHMGVWKCCVPLNPMVNDHYPY